MVTSDGYGSHANYSLFKVDDETNCYNLTVDGFSGHISDRLGGSGTTSHNGKCFSTHDKDNDVSQEHNCAMQFQGGWWYHSCYTSNLNGVYSSGNTSSETSAVWAASQKSALHTIVMRITRDD
ncbi:hypothetical protein EB796_012418 [Bugula neritina]|uniref:Fibrinogen C-terminal domain-containing protein n=1 Tax=Bugula neritina TaxID=10212 RepID=A0A7J7JSE4_BUGNE|nr:hypothetical protein EB796_012418 [Bugula neritina]